VSEGFVWVSERWINNSIEIVCNWGG
jgi:hypothetical protein